MGVVSGAHVEITNGRIEDNHTYVCWSPYGVKITLNSRRDQKCNTFISVIKEQREPENHVGD